MNLSMLLDMASSGFGDRTIIGPRSDGITVDELGRLSHGGASLIREAGASALLYLDVNGPAYPAALFAAARAGVPLVPINYRLSGEQLTAMLNRHPGAITLTGANSDTTPAAPTRTVMTTDEWLARSAARGDVEVEVESAAEDAPAVVIYTSGTTSTPKGVLLRHDNLVSYVLGSVEFSSADDDSAALVSVPPYHIAAVANAITNLYAGRRCIVLESFTGQQWLQLVRDEKISNALVVPTMLSRIVGCAADKSVPSLRTLAYGGASMPPRVIASALQLWPHVDFVNAYGLTETSSTVAVLGPEDHRAALDDPDPAVRARLGSAGQPVPSIEMVIRDEQNRDVPPGTRGRIWVRGDQISGEYDGLGSVLDADGWFDTRDEGHLDAAGYLFIAGRSDDTIIRGGENIAPAEIEETLLRHEGIDDAVVIGVPDDEWGQRLEAAVVAVQGAHLDPEEIRDYVRARLRSSKTPDRVVVWSELPRTETGKILRRTVLAQIGADTAGQRPVH